MVFGVMVLLSLERIWYIKIIRMIVIVTVCS